MQDTLDFLNETSNDFENKDSSSGTLSPTEIIRAPPFLHLSSRFPSSVPPRSYSRTMALGKGGHSCVYKYSSLQSSGAHAVKILHVQKTKEEYILREKEIHKSLDHPNVVKYYFSCFS